MKKKHDIEIRLAFLIEWQNDKRYNRDVRKSLLNLGEIKALQWVLGRIK